MKKETPIANVINWIINEQNENGSLEAHEIQQKLVLMLDEENTHLKEAFYDGINQMSKSVQNHNHEIITPEDWINKKYFVFT